MKPEVVGEFVLKTAHSVGIGINRFYTRYLDLDGYTPEEEHFARRVLAGETTEDLKAFYNSSCGRVYVPGRFPGTGYSFSTGVNWVAGLTHEQVHEDMVKHARILVGHAYDPTKPPVFGR